MAVNVEELQGKPAEELIALIEKQDASIVKFQEGGDKPAENAPAATPAEKPADVPADKPADAPAADKPADEAGKQLSEVKDENKNLKEQQEKDGKTIKELTERNRLSDIDAKLSDYAGKGLPTPVIDKMREVMLADIGETTIKLSEVVKDGDKDKTVEKDHSLSDAVCVVVDSFPTIMLGEKTVIHSDGRSDLSSKDEGKDKELKEVKDYMKENKCSFKEAQSKLFVDKKIKSRGY